MIQLFTCRDQGYMHGHWYVTNPANRCLFFNFGQAAPVFAVVSERG